MFYNKAVEENKFNRSASVVDPKHAAWASPQLQPLGNWGGRLPVAGDPGHFHQGQMCLLENTQAFAA